MPQSPQLFESVNTEVHRPLQIICEGRQRGPLSCTSTPVSIVTGTSPVASPLRTSVLPVSTTGTSKCAGSAGQPAQTAAINATSKQRRSIIEDSMVDTKVIV